MKSESRPESGLSLIEMSMVMIVIAIMSVAIIQGIRNMSQSHTAMVNQTKVSSLSERVAAAIEVDIGHAMRVFSEIGSDRDYFARMQMAERTPLAESRMPTATMLGHFDLDPEDEVQTGNLLFLARRDGHEEVDASATPGSPDLCRVDLVRFIAWFLETGEETGVDLSRWSSVRIARAEDVVAITDVDRQRRMCMALRDVDVRHLWQPGLDAAAAFFRIEPDGTLSALSSSDLIPDDLSASEFGILGTRYVGIAANGSVPADVPQFARAKPGFPHGFEVKRDGDGTGDLVLVRLVCATKAQGRRVAVGEVTRHVAFRDG